MAGDAAGTNGSRSDSAVCVIIPTIEADTAMLNRCLNQVWETAKEVDTVVSRGGTFAENCNRAAVDSHSEYLVFLNDDTLPQPGWLDPLIAALRYSHIAGSRLIYPDGSIQHAGVYFTMVDGILTANNWQEERESGPVDAVTGACLAIRRTDFMEMNGFDEGFKNGYEDVDLCLRVRQHGGKIVYCAESTVIHYESKSGPARWAHVNDNVRRLQELWVVNEPSG